MTQMGRYKHTFIDGQIWQVWKTELSSFLFRTIRFLQFQDRNNEGAKQRESFQYI
jgi:hypothetical protein